jgi:hypothetical protein
MMICKEVDAYDWLIFELLVFVSMAFVCLLLSNVFPWRMENCKVSATIFW